MKKLVAILLFVIGVASGNVLAQPAELEEIAKIGTQLEGKRPVVIIPGILGSELVNKYSGEKVWFSLRRSKDDDLRLPISTSIERSRDNLIPGDILRSVDFFITKQDFYGGFARSLSRFGGYKEESIDGAPETLKDRFFVFPYDWRRDNVETAHILLQKLEALRKKTGEKNIKFDIVAHSMGGLVARYAAMYGNKDLINDRPRPNWAGAKVINQIYTVGTPNHGAADSFQSLLEGFGAISGINLPFVRDLSPLEVFSMPALFQLLPHSENPVFYDEDLKPMDVDLFDYRTWEKYRWSFYGEEKLNETMTDGGIARLETYLVEVLTRANRFHKALDAGANGAVKVTAFGSDCADTLDAYVLVKNGNNDTWQTITKPTAFTKSNGEKADITEVRTVMMKQGDGRVATSSLDVDSFGNAASVSVCEKHDMLLSNSVIQRHILSGIIQTDTAK